MDSDDKADVWKTALLAAALVAAYVAQLIWK